MQLVFFEIVKMNMKLSVVISVEPMSRFELLTSSLPRKRSTPELHRQKNLSERPGSNRRQVSQKGIGVLLPIISIVFLAMANKAIKKDEDLVKSVDRLR